MIANIAVIVAHGEGGLQPLFGMPAVQRLIVLLGRIGIGQIVIVAQEPIASAVRALCIGDASRVLDSPSALEQWLQSEDVDPTAAVLVARADHVIDEKSLSAFVHGFNGSTGAGGEKNDDAGMVYVLNSRGAPPAHAMYLTGRGALPGVVAAVESDLTPDRAALRITDVPEQNGLPSVVRDGRSGITSAEALLTAVLPSGTAHRDGFMARHFDRHLSRVISRRVARTVVTPNAVTMFNTIVGLTAAFFLWKGGYWSQLAGTLLFLACVVLDGVDGEVARLKLRESVFGHYLDIITDNIIHVAVFAGLGIGLYRSTGDRLYLDLLVLLLGGFVFCALAVYNLSRNIGAERPAAAGKLVSLLANRDFAYLLVVLAAVGRLAWFLAGAAVGSYVFAVVLFGLSLGARRAPAQT